MTDINKYITLKTALLNEKAKLEARLGEISKVFGADVVVATAPSPTTTTTPGKRTFSAVTKAKMAAAQKARWAAKKGGAAVSVPPAVPAPTPKNSKRTMSEATKAKMRAAHQARWAAKKGTVAAGVPVAAAPKVEPQKPKRKVSPEAKARMIAGAKKRWANSKVGSAAAPAAATRQLADERDIHARLEAVPGTVAQPPASATRILRNPQSNLPASQDNARPTNRSRGPPQPAGCPTNIQTQRASSKGPRGTAPAGKERLPC